MSRGVVIGVEQPGETEAMSEPDNIVTLAVYTNVIEAQLVRNRLVAEGIRAQLDSDMGGGPLPGMETTFASVHLLVPESEAERAAAILGFADEEVPEPEQEEDEEPSSTAIREQGTTGTRGPRENEPSPSTAIKPGPSDDRRALAEEAARPEAEKDEEYEPDDDLQGAVEEDDEELQLSLNRRITWSVDDYASHAMRAAIFGLITIPVVLHLYSLWLLLRMALLSEDASRAAMRKVYLALAIDLAVLAGVGLIFLSVVYR